MARAAVAGVSPRALRRMPRTAAVWTSPLGNNAPVCQEVAVPPSQSAAPLSAPVCPAPDDQRDPPRTNQARPPGQALAELARTVLDGMPLISKATGAAVSTATAANKGSAQVTEPDPLSRNVSPLLPGRAYLRMIYSATQPGPHVAQWPGPRAPADRDIAPSRRLDHSARISPPPPGAAASSHRAGPFNEVSCSRPAGPDARSVRPGRCGSE